MTTILHTGTGPELPEKVVETIQMAIQETQEKLQTDDILVIYNEKEGRVSAMSRTDFFQRLPLPDLANPAPPCVEGTPWPTYWLIVITEKGTDIGRMSVGYADTGSALPLPQPLVKGPPCAPFLGQLDRLRLCGARIIDGKGQTHPHIHTLKAEDQLPLIIISYRRKPGEPYPLERLIGIHVQ